MDVPRVRGGLREQVTYFKEFGRLSLSHTFAKNYSGTGYMTFTLRFFNDGKQTLYLAIGNAVCWNLFNFFVGNVAVKSYNQLLVRAEDRWFIDFEIPPAQYFEIDIEAIYAGQSVFFPGSGVFETGVQTFDVECVYGGVVSNRITVDLTQSK